MDHLYYHRHNWRASLTYRQQKSGASSKANMDKSDSKHSVCTYHEKNFPLRKITPEPESISWPMGQLERCFLNLSEITISIIYSFIYRSLIRTYFFMWKGSLHYTTQRIALSTLCCNFLLHCLSHIWSLIVFGILLHAEEIY